MFPFLSREIKHLFARGEGGRHDWMRFHANDVKCPLTVKMTADKEYEIDCFGLLRWTNNKKQMLQCDQCKAVFEVKFTARIVKKSARVPAGPEEGQ